MEVREIVILSWRLFKNACCWRRRLRLELTFFAGGREISRHLLESMEAAQLMELRYKMERLEESHICSICLENAWNVAFLCGHSACSKCAESLTLCHMCRKPIQSKINLFTWWSAVSRSHSSIKSTCVLFTLLFFMFRAHLHGWHFGWIGANRCHAADTFCHWSVLLLEFHRRHLRRVSEIYLCCDVFVSRNWRFCLTF